MTIDDLMRLDPVTIGPEATLHDAIALMLREGVRHLPVLEGDRLAGIVSDRDVRLALPSPLSSDETEERQRARGHAQRLTVADIMTRDVMTVTPADPVEEAALRLVTHRISAMPVVDQDRLVGIVTTTDLLWAMVDMLVENSTSTKVQIAVEEGDGVFQQVKDVVESLGGRLDSVATFNAPEQTVLVADAQLPCLNEVRRELERRGLVTIEHPGGAAREEGTR